MTSDKNIFTRRALRPLVCGRHFEEAESAENPAPTNHVAAVPLSLKSVRVREYQNVR
ncbi:hypothetical protein SAMN04487895_1084 [Paenibacillus sophorae]|uniref:Uncharacterized protein n=1 Tax=Paenibacillus sophorae TaxID=1333845 RepID=A0A1H8Q002_9BACL|nr:hypothetical protein SAMN04487895_1084 [Paenibacillus sophorae]